MAGSPASSRALPPPECWGWRPLQLHYAVVYRFWGSTSGRACTESDFLRPQPFVLFPGTFLLCNPSWPRTHKPAQASPELMPRPLECWVCATILGHAALLQNPQERGEKRGQESKGGRREDGREEEEFKCQEDGDTEKKVRNHKHTHKIKRLLC